METNVIRMRAGWMWACFDKRLNVSERIAQARERYVKRWGFYPDTCVLHPTELVDGVVADGMVLLTAKNIRPNHYWLGLLEQDHS